MEEISAREAAGSPRVQFQSLETQYEGLPPEPQVVQDTAMEQGLAGAPPVPQVPALPHEGSPGDQAAALLTARYQPGCVISGVCDIRGCGCAPYPRGMGMPGPCSEGALQRSDVRELWERGLAGISNFQA
ncbi:zinc finger protein 655 [Rhinolophus ferrumequinum]|uniref:Zinc finger protein 655 n=1 Tax=Rhinolophus ferrumequinum TaxID=59479 RepID=A0A7J7Y7C2_RHIFE|nr:zinc finger protein 655 [Rhinolophus ferrumequinum]